MDEKSLILSCKRFTFIKINKIQIIEDHTLDLIMKKIEDAFSMTMLFSSSDFCGLWMRLIDIQNEFHKELLVSMELKKAFDELIYLASYLAKGGDSRRKIQ